MENFHSSNRPHDVNVNIDVVEINPSNACVLTNITKHKNVSCEFDMKLINWQSEIFESYDARSSDLFVILIGSGRLYFVISLIKGIILELNSKKMILLFFKRNLEHPRIF